MLCIPTNTKFINLWNVVVAFFKPNAMRVNFQCPQGVEEAVLDPLDLVVLKL